MPGRALPAAQPHTEFTTSSVVPGPGDGVIDRFRRAQFLEAEHGELFAHRGDEVFGVALGDHDLTTPWRRRGRRGDAATCGNVQPDVAAIRRPSNDSAGRPAARRFTPYDGNPATAGYARANDRPAGGGRYVLYWMIGARRAEWNFALEHAVGRGAGARPRPGRVRAAAARLPVGVGPLPPLRHRRHGRQRPRLRRAGRDLLPVRRAAPRRRARPAGGAGRRGGAGRDRRRARLLPARAWSRARPSDAAGAARRRRRQRPAARCAPPTTPIRPAYAFRRFVQNTLRRPPGRPSAGPAAGRRPGRRRARRCPRP